MAVRGIEESRAEQYHGLWGKGLRILLYGLNYAPELTGIGKYSGELGAWLARRGHEVRVVTAPPYYPAWRIDEAYRATSYRLEQAPGAPTVFRVPLWVPARPTGVKRIVHLLSFAVSSAPVLMLQPLWQPDVVLNVEPAFFSAPLAWMLARFCGAKAWLHVQDFEVDAAFELGLLPQGGPVQGLARLLEEGLTRRFDRVSSISPLMVARLGSKGIPEARRVLFPNWVTLDEPQRNPDEPQTNLDDVSSLAPTDTLRQELGLTGELVVLYSGNMGAKQGLDLLAPLVRSLAGTAQVAGRAGVAADQRLVFLFCGDGAYRPQLEREVEGLANVRLLPLQPAERLGALLRTADIHLLPQRAGAADLVLPSKLAGMLASGRPVLATAAPGTEIGRTVEGRGLVVPPGDPAALRTGLLRLASDPGLRQRLGDAARAYAVEHLGKEQVLRRFEAELFRLLRGDR